MLHKVGGKGTGSGGEITLGKAGKSLFTEKNNNKMASHSNMFPVHFMFTSYRTVCSKLHPLKIRVRVQHPDLQPEVRTFCQQQWQIITVVRCLLLWRVFYNKPDENLSIQSEDMTENGFSVQLDLVTQLFDLIEIWWHVHHSHIFFITPTKFHQNRTSSFGARACNRQTDRQTDWQTDRLTDRPTDRPTDQQTDIQTDTLSPRCL